MSEIAATKAKSLIERGRAPEGMVVDGPLDLSGLPITSLPAGLDVSQLNLSNCEYLRELPAGLKVRKLILNGCTRLEALPSGLSVYELDMRRTGVTTLPADLRVEYRLNLEDSERLESLPTGLAVGSLILRNCTALEALPEGLTVYFLDISGCSGLTSWPAQANVRIGRVIARHCTGLTDLPEWLNLISHLDLRGCIGIGALPANLRVSGWIDLADTQVVELPLALKGVRLRWRGVMVDERIVFRPETITGDEIMHQENVELRRVLIERMGYDNFLETVNAKVLNRDMDAGGERQLLRVEMNGDEPLVCVSVRCPSTARQYIIRVPPQMRSCHQAVAWIAGFDNPDDYRPIVES